jgi:hypothetical protein
MSRRLLAPLADVESDEGSMMVISVLVMLILSTLSLATLARALTSMQFVRTGQDYDGALAAADAGIAEALYKIDQSAPATWTASGTTGEATYQYKAEKKSDVEYWISSVGAVGRSHHGVKVKVTRTKKFPFAIFTQQKFSVTGDNATSVYSFNVFGGPHTGQAFVGSNNKIVISGGGGGDAQHTYGPNGGCSGCPNEARHPDAPFGGPGGVPVVTTASVPPGPVQACPANGAFPAIIDGFNGVPFVCSGNVTFPVGAVSVTRPPFILYVIPTAALPFPTVDLAKAEINGGGPSRDVQLYLGEVNLVLADKASSSKVTFSGAIYAPQSSVNIPGGKYMTGSLMLNSLVIDTSQNTGTSADYGFVLGYDVEGLPLATDWTVSRYAEVPSRSLAVT